MNNKISHVKIINSTEGGQTIVIEIRGSSCSILRASKKPVTANFELQYAVRKGKPTSPEIELKTIICPTFFFK